MIKKDSLNSPPKSNTILDSKEDFAYYLPCEELKNLISNYTVTFPNKQMISENYTIIPHGSATLVYTYDGTHIKGKLFGPMSKPCVVGKEANECSLIFIIEFQPAGLYVFTGIGQNKLIDEIVPFEYIDTRLDSAIKEILNLSGTAKELLCQIEDLLLQNQVKSYPSEFSLATKLIIEHYGNITSKEISNTIFYSERHLNRIFNYYLGVSMKHFARIVRVNQSIRLLNNPRNSLEYVCRSSGFYDGSHFIKDFKAVCGITPQRYRENMSDFYNEIAKF